jgi:hypothetical protein
MCERRCYCEKCDYCRQRDRYERERPLRLRRSKARQLQTKYNLEDANRLLDDFVAGRLSLNDLEVELNGRA